MSCNLSIIIPAYNEAKLISQGLASIAKHLCGISYEIIVVDNGSVDTTAKVVGQCEGARVVSIARSTISGARNSGAKFARGRLFAFLDADVLVTPRWARAVAQKLAIASTGTDYFGGYPFDIPEHASSIERAWFVASTLGRLTYVGSANLLVSASLFHKVGGFDESLPTAEDVDFGRRVRRAGVPIDFDPELHVIHLGFPRTFRHFVKREKWHGLGSFRNLPTFLQSKVSVAAVATAALLALSVSLLVTDHIRAGLVALILHLAMPLLYVIYRFQFRNFRYLPLQYVLGYLYLASRAASGVSALSKLATSGHRSS